MKVILDVGSETKMTISPWEYKDVELPSPDGTITASIRDPMEIAMGAPTDGDLALSNGMSRIRCNPSMVWSSDSEYLAVPEWTKDRKQRLLIISISRRQSRYAPGEYRVLELESFDGSTVKGIDSPIHMPKAVEFDVSQIDWRDSQP